MSDLQYKGEECIHWSTHHIPVTEASSFKQREVLSLSLLHYILLDVSLPWPNRTYWICLGYFYMFSCFPKLCDSHPTAVLSLLVFLFPIFRRNQTILCYTWERFALRRPKSFPSLRGMLLIYNYKWILSSGGCSFDFHVFSVHSAVLTQTL